MPSFNQHEYLERSLLSVLGQAPVELVVADGGSTDGTVEILQQYSPALSRWWSRLDSGQSAAVNEAARMSNSNILTWQNSNDLLLDGAIEAAEMTLADPGIDVVYGSHIHIDEHDRVLDFYPSLPPSPSRLRAEGFFGNAQTVFLRRSVWEAIGGLDEDLHLRMDLDFFMNLLEIVPSRRIMRLDQPLAAFRIHGDQKTGGSEAHTIELSKIEAKHGFIRNSRVNHARRAALRLTRFGHYLRSGGPGYCFWRSTRALQARQSNGLGARGRGTTVGE